ncbi:dATP/dGTP pyrophosphohydrolase domain-containing protein [Fibrella forsythiae]|uniref:DUF550 domain-containing protein n=1 Tax=Fibrella forsythiae TaxID=2817061 RepID=A0ABS3JPP8_9BACT|nr:dATP/dGTP pyrophosphohydrolase domain-containing protein [Fibrella forsythiae]MBO0950897.1 DUF550 domain-containing protein [Fibrella forsythiae]
MNKYHPNADPQFVAMDSHYMNLATSEFLQSLHTCFDKLGYISLESDKRDFCYSLWKHGYKLVPVAKSITELEAERFAWSRETFTEATAISSLRKLESEIKEIEADILKGNDPTTEYADALMCLFDSAGRHGISVDQITEAFAKKLEINKGRQWRKNPDDSYSHVQTNGDQHAGSQFYIQNDSTPPLTDDSQAAYSILP